VNYYSNGSDPPTAKFIVEFMAHLLYYLDLFGLRKVDSLVDILFEMFNTLVTVGSANPENLVTAAEMLKVYQTAWSVLKIF
jgi:hypothetical protein